MSDDRKTWREVFVNDVEDRLRGTPHASHPVQFEGGICQFCGATVTTGWQDVHRRWHDAHNAEHDRIDEAARRYVSPPTYGRSTVERMRDAGP